MKVLTDEKALELAKKLLGNDKTIRDVLVVAIKKVISDCKEYSDSLAVNYDPAGTASTEVQNLAKGQVKKNKDTLDVLTGTGEGSVEKRVADAVASIIADAPDALDTLKEISDWIFEHEDDASAMNSGIATNKREIGKLAKLIGALPEDAGVDTIVEYIDTLGMGYATAEQGRKADTAVQTVVTGTENGTVAVDGEDVEVKGLGNSAFGNIFTGTREDYEIAVSRGEIKENTIVNITDDEDDIIMGLKKADEEISKLKVVAEPYFLQYGVSTVEEAIAAYRDGKELIAWDCNDLLKPLNRKTICRLSYIDGESDLKNESREDGIVNCIFKFSTVNDVTQQFWSLGTKNSTYPGWQIYDEFTDYFNVLRGHSGHIEELDKKTKTISNQLSSHISDCRQVSSDITSLKADNVTFQKSLTTLSDNLNRIESSLLNFTSEPIAPNTKFRIERPGIYIFAGYDYNLATYQNDVLVGKENNLITALFVTKDISFYGKTYKGTLNVASVESGMVDFSARNIYVHNTNTSHEARVFYLKAGE